jgi:hypothetical protein
MERTLSVTPMMQYMATLKPIWQGVISAAVTVTTGLIVLGVYLLTV